MILANEATAKSEPRAVVPLANNLLSIGLLTICIAGCENRRDLPPPIITAKDMRLVQESVAFTKQVLSDLPDDDEVVRRYGKFISMEVEKVERNRAQAFAYGDGGSPASLAITCRCKFEKFPTRLGLAIVQGKPGSQLDFFSGQYKLVLEPTTATFENGVLSDAKPQIIDNELWYVRQTGNIQVRCVLGAMLTHPDFDP